MHRSGRHRAHECLRIIGLEREVEELLYLLFGVLEVKDGLDKTGIKKSIKTAKKCMHWNVAPAQAVDFEWLASSVHYFSCIN